MNNIEKEQQRVILGEAFKTAAAPQTAALKNILTQIREIPSEQASRAERDIEHCLAGFLMTMEFATVMGNLKDIYMSADSYLEMRLDGIDRQVDERFNPLPAIEDIRARVRETIEAHPDLFSPLVI